MAYRCPSTHVVSNPAALLDPVIGRAFAADSKPITIACKDPDEGHVEHFGTVIPFPGFADVVVRWNDPPAPKAAVAVRTLPLSAKESRALLLLEAVARAIVAKVATDAALPPVLEVIDTIRTVEDPDPEVEGS
jgi:hypothetical protein